MILAMEISLTWFKRYYPRLFLIAGPSLSCLFIFYFLFTLFIPLQLTIPIVIVVGVMLIGLVKYYTDFFGNKFNEMEVIKLDAFVLSHTSAKYSIFWNLTFICAYGAAMLIHCRRQI